MKDLKKKDLKKEESYIKTMHQMRKDYDEILHNMNIAAIADAVYIIVFAVVLIFLKVMGVSEFAFNMVAVIGCMWAFLFALIVALTVIAYVRTMKDLDELFLTINFNYKKGENEDNKHKKD